MRVSRSRCRTRHWQARARYRVCTGCTGCTRCAGCVGCGGKGCAGCGSWVGCRVQQVVHWVLEHHARSVRQVRAQVFPARLRPVPAAWFQVQTVQRAQPARVGLEPRSRHDPPQRRVSHAVGTTSAGARSVLVVSRPPAATPGSLAAPGTPGATALGAPVAPGAPAAPGAPRARAPASPASSTRAIADRRCDSYKYPSRHRRPQQRHHS